VKESEARLILTVIGLPNVFPFMPDILLALGIVVSVCEYPCSSDDTTSMLTHAEVSSVFVPSELCDISKFLKKRSIPLDVIFWLVLTEAEYVVPSILQ
jgi:hypothetical protein